MQNFKPHWGGEGLHPNCHFAVHGSNDYVVPLNHLELLQHIVAETGTTLFPLLLRLGGKYPVRMQPVVARALLAEWEIAQANLVNSRICALYFRDANGSKLGGFFPTDNSPTFGTAERLVQSTAEGVRVSVRQLPPPIGFRSGPRMGRGWYECYFRRLERQGENWIGYRTAEMGGSGEPVTVKLPPVPPVTRWDFARTAGTPEVTTIEGTSTPVLELLSNVVHALETSCNDSLRLKRPLHFHVD